MIQLIHRTLIETSRYQLNAHETDVRIDVACNTCREDKTFPLFINSRPAMSLTELLAVITRHEDIIHRAVKA